MASVAALGRAAIISGFLASGTPSYGNRLHVGNTSPSKQNRTKSSKTGFYRQPSKTRKKNTTTADVRRKQFAQKLQWYSDAGDDNLGVEDDGQPRRHSASETQDRKHRGRSSSPTPILKRMESDTSGYSSGDRRSSGGGGAAGRKTHFRDVVEVIYFDQRDRPMASATYHNEKLKVDSQNTLRVTERLVNISCNLHPDGTCHGTHHRRSSLNDSMFATTSVFDGLNVDMYKCEDGKYKFKMFIPIGQDFVRNRTSVKALSGGRKLILMAYKIEKQANGIESLHQYVEKMSLPHAVDAYCVRASMDKDGNLKINAPLLQMNAMNATSSVEQGSDSTSSEEDTAPLT